MKTSHRPVHRFSLFLIANSCALLYAFVSLLISQWWVRSLALKTGYPSAWMIVLFIAIIPGYLNALLVAHLLVYRYQSVRMNRLNFPPITILSAAFNEEDVIQETCRGIGQQNYPGHQEVIFVDDGSSDRTVEELQASGLPNLKVIRSKHGGKAAALNLGLRHCKTEILVMIDADTFLYRNAVKRIVARLMSNPNYAAVAGQVLAKNERWNRLTRTQSWDYLLAISAVKRQQGFFGGTLVAQGAFSVFRRSAILSVGGWENRIGEDIVLSWALLEKGYDIGYEPAAFAFTHVPTGFGGFARQRQRWARGMIEGFKSHGRLLWKRRRYPAFFVFLNLFFPVVDFFYTFVFIPGVVLAFFGYYYIAGLMTLLVIPLNALIMFIMAQSQKKFMDFAGLRIRRNPIGLACYMLFYQILLSPICTVGYFKELIRWRRRW